MLKLFCTEKVTCICTFKAKCERSDSIQVEKSESNMRGKKTKVTDKIQMSSAYRRGGNNCLLLKNDSIIIWQLNKPRETVHVSEDKETVLLLLLVLNFVAQVLVIGAIETGRRLRHTLKTQNTPLWLNDRRDATHMTSKVS